MLRKKLVDETEGIKINAGIGCARILPGMQHGLLLMTRISEAQLMLLVRSSGVRGEKIQNQRKHSTIEGRTESPESYENGRQCEKSNRVQFCVKGSQMQHK